MRFKLFFASLSLLLGGVAFGQVVGQPLSQSLTVSTVAPPANTPLLGSTLSCTGGGSFAANTYLIAYTYTGTAASSESKASADGGATLTTLVTCPANGTLTIPSPPPAPGCFNCVGWRPYVIASSSGTGAELLQTITAANCTLAATSGLTACAIGSSFTETSLGAGAAIPTNPTLFTPTPGAFASIVEIAPAVPGTGVNLGYATHHLQWVVSGTAATCTIAVDSSTDGVSFSAGGVIAGQTCTSSGAITIYNVTANFVRLNLTAFTATGANTPSITVTYTTNPNSNLGGPIIGQVYSSSLTPGASTAAIQTTGQVFATFTGVISGDEVYLIAQPVPTSLCPAVAARATAANTITIYFTTLTAGACTPAAGTYSVLAVR